MHRCCNSMRCCAGLSSCPSLMEDRWIVFCLDSRLSKPPNPSPPGDQLSRHLSSWKEHYCHYGSAGPSPFLGSASTWSRVYKGWSGCRRRTVVVDAAWRHVDPLRGTPRHGRHPGGFLVKTNQSVLLRIQIMLIHLKTYIRNSFFFFWLPLEIK